MKADYIITHSGRMVSRNGQDSVPSEQDLALSLSRQPRFAGFARRWWSVLDHSLFVAALMTHNDEPAHVQLAGLLHDAHEFTGDIPTPFKTDEQRTLQHELDDRIFLHYYNGPLSLRTVQRVKDYDRRALLAEAFLVGPPLFTDGEEVRVHFGAKPYEDDVVVLARGLMQDRLGVSACELERGVQAYNVRGWLLEVKLLRGIAATEDKWNF